MEIITDKIITEKNMPVTFGRECHICGESFDIIDRYDTRTICPECQKRLKALLYQEKEE